MLTDPNALAAKAAEHAYSAGNLVTCDGYYEFDLDAAQAAIAAVIAPELERRDREIERLREVGAGAWVPAEQFIALRKELELAAKFIGGMKHTKAGEAAFERARTALGASHDADA